MAGQQTLLDSEESAFLDLINAYRVENGVPPLNISPTLTDASRWMSNDMATNDYFSHTDSLGRGFSQRLADFGYDYNTYRGENLAAGSEDAQYTFELWRNSPGHNENMLDERFVVIGVGRAYGPESEFGWYWATDFGGYDDGGSPPPTNTPAPTETPVSTPTLPPATPTPTSTLTPTSTPEPTDTPLPSPTTTAPTSTAVPSPTGTTQALPTQEPSPSPASEPAPSVIPSPEPSGGAPPAPASGFPSEPGASFGIAPPTVQDPTSGPGPAPTIRELVPGWNQIEYSDRPARLTEVLPVDDGKLTAVYAWDTEQGRWRRYLPGIAIPGLNTLAELESRQQVWILATERVILTLPA